MSRNIESYMMLNPMNQIYSKGKIPKKWNPPQFH
jgi:hypothetical protein